MTKYKKVLKSTYDHLVDIARLAGAYLDIVTCKKCGKPHVSQYVCYFCGDDGAEEDCEPGVKS